MSTLQDLAKKIAEIEKQMNSLGSSGRSLQPAVDALKAASNNTADLSNNLQKADDLLEIINDRIDSLNADLKYTLKSFQSIISEMTKGRNNVNMIKSSTRELTSIASKLLDYQNEISNISVKELKSLQQKAKEEFESLKRSQEDLKLRKNQGVATKEELNTLNNITHFLEKNNKLEETFNRQIGVAINKQKQVEESLGITGSILKGISELPGISALGKHLKVDDAVESMQNYTRKLIEAAKNSKEIDFAVTNDNIKFFSDEIEKIQEQLKSSNITQTHRKKLENDLIKLTKELNKNLEKKVQLEEEAIKAATGYKAKIGTLREGFKSLIEGISKGLLDPMFIIGAIVKGFDSLNKAQTDFTQQTGRNINHFDTINTSLISSSDYIKQATSLTKQFGVQADAVFTRETLQEATEMVELMSMGANEAGTLAKFSKLSNKELKLVNDNIVRSVNNFIKTNKVAINQRAVLEDISKISDEIALTFDGNPEKIAAAATEARKLGINLDQVNKVANSLLEFESSISAELEAELLIGKELNLERARFYALTNDLTNLTKEIGKNQEIINTFASGNRIEQEAIAKAMGLSREEISKMIFQQKLQDGLSEKEAARLSNMNAEDLKRLSVQESINKSIQKMTEALAGPLEMLASLLSHSETLYAIIAAIGSVMSISLVKSMAEYGRLLITAIPKLGTILGLESGIAAAKISGAMAATIGLGALGIIAGIAATMGAFKSSVDEAKSTKFATGGIVTGEINNATIGEAGPEAIIPLNSPRGKEILGGNSDIDMISELRNIKETLINIANKTGVIMLDGKQVGKVVTPLVNTENIKIETQIS